MPKFVVIGEEAASADQVLFTVRPDRRFTADYSDEHLITANPQADG